MIKTLALLVASLSVGTFVLRVMETDPARPAGALDLRASEKALPGVDLAALGQTDVPLQRIKWRNIVIHDAAVQASRTVQGCHFVIGDARRFGDGVVQSTQRWRRQSDGDHIRVPGYDFNANSVGICVLCDSRLARPSDRQFDADIATMVKPACVNHSRNSPARNRCI